MGHYRSNVRDLEFNLFEVFDTGIGRGPFAQTDADTARRLLRETAALASGAVADCFADADRNPPVFDPQSHSVTVTPSLARMYRQLWADDWHRLMLPSELGGFGVPPSVQWAAVELLVSANPALHLYFSAAPNCAAIIDRTGTEEQRRWARFMVERGWSATMVITEPDAGSEVGAARTRAIRQPDGSWHIDGVKRFITGGDHDITENILHLVLARPEGPGITSRPGTKGLSLFLVPKFLFDPESGVPGARNGVYATNLESKMGIRGSATCELSFGQHGVPAQGWLLGDVHEGIAQMFQVISWARMTVGIKAIGTLSTGHLNAVEYAKQRVQGSDLRRIFEKGAPSIPIVDHPEVRRSLLLQKAYAEGLRALYLYAATLLDQVEANEGDVRLARSLNELLLPLVKGVGAERAAEQLQHALQIFGGSGFLQDYPLEQYVRDQRIDSLYEGTTAIQSMDLLFRKIVRDNAQTLTALISDIRAFNSGEAGNGRLKEGRSFLGEAADDIEAMLAKLAERLFAVQSDPDQMLAVGEHTVRFMMSIGDLVIGWLLLRQADVAIAALDAGASGPDADFYRGKVAVATYFATTVLPELSVRRRLVENSGGTLMAMSAAEL
ncbi:acyl-CoA dehydrogenase [Micromonospora sp. NPDC048898]|uniref:acyl-CoA dehydrogenase n=1 Tax=Micromonospora sp. NPDC048898 TaxID=3364260 RepID=UPI00371B2987